MTQGKTAIIIGAGPAGLTAAVELLDRTDIHPIVLERDDCMGGIARTVNYKGNRIDLGGHRFFSKSDRVMQWWLSRMPIEAGRGNSLRLQYQGRQHEMTPGPGGPDPATTDRVMLVRPRRSRIYFLRRFFDYPIRLSAQTLANLGPWRTLRIGASYLASVLRPIRQPRNLEEFFISRFGRVLYETFFKSYTEKVWGVPCTTISAEWGAQRIKGLSISRAVWHAIRKPFVRRDVAQKGTETTLIEQFLYPKLGPGQMWDEVRDEILRKGGEIRTHQIVDQIEWEGDRVIAAIAIDPRTGERTRYQGEVFFSTMAIRDLVAALHPEPPPDVCKIAEGLVYRDFMTVGLLVNRLKVQEHRGGGLIRDNWIYIQEPEVRVGRMQIFNNWSPWMVADPGLIWIGLEYFCNVDDDLWSLPDDALVDLAKRETASIGILDAADVRDATVIRMPKCYPAYFGSYDRFDDLRQWLDGRANLYLIGRNGMHRYNNQDHSMLTAMVAVDNLVADRSDHAAIWAVNTEQEYHETKAAVTESGPR